VGVAGRRDSAHSVAVVETELTLENPVGLHARPAAVFVKLVASLSSRVTIANLDRDPEAPADGRSILAVLALGASRGSRIRVTAEGPNEIADLAAIRRLVESGLGESLAEHR
jgi:phosphotransferase system HPr (HPr) family protein